MKEQDKLVAPCFLLNEFFLFSINFRLGGEKKRTLPLPAIDRSRSVGCQIHVTDSERLAPPRRALQYSRSCRELRYCATTPRMAQLQQLQQSQPAVTALLYCSAEFQMSYISYSSTKRRLVIKWRPVACSISTASAKTYIHAPTPDAIKKCHGTYYTRYTISPPRHNARTAVACLQYVRHHAGEIDPCTTLTTPFPLLATTHARTAVACLQYLRHHAGEIRAEGRHPRYEQPPVRYLLVLG